MGFFSSGFSQSFLLLRWSCPAGAQGLPPFAGQGGAFIPSSPSTTPQLLAPPNPLGAPGSAYEVQPGSDIIPLSSGMFSGIIPRISNLELGFLYNFGNNVRMGRFSADYVLPFSLSCDSVIFGEAHGEWENFWKTPTVSVTSVSGSTVTTSGTSNRVDLSFGGGYRTMLGESTLLGVNGFYDASRLFNTWYSSGGVGLEMAALLGGDAALDLNVNWYGNLFTRDGLINAFRNKGGSYDVEAGYSQSLFNQAVDLRLKATGYQFDIGSPVYGWRTGADLTTRDGVFSLKYEYGHDGVNGSYNTVGGFVNIGFQLENVLNGESPFTLPEPIFNSPRNLRRMLTQKVKRDWHQPTAVVLTRTVSTAAGGRRLEFLGVTNSGSFPSAIQNVDLSAATFDLVRTLPLGLFNLLSYQFRMSDGSIQNVRGTILTVSDPAGIVGPNVWSVSLSPVAGPSPMNAPNADTFLTFGQEHILVLVDQAGGNTATVTVTLDVPSDPSIVPLVITITVIDIF